MSVFQHHPDGIIYIRVGTQTYASSVADFEADCVSLGLVYEGLPVGKVDRIYLQDSPPQHTCADSHGNMEHLPHPYNQGEEFITAFDQFLLLQEAREAAAAAVLA